MVLPQVLAYVWAPEEEAQFQPGRASRWWLYNSLKTLEKQIEARGGFICYRRGPRAVDQILQICKEVSASAVYFNNCFDPLSLVRDHEVKAQLNDAGIVAHNFNAELLFEPWTVLDDNGGPFTTFEEFWNKYESDMFCSIVGCRSSAFRPTLVHASFCPVSVSHSCVHPAQTYSSMPCICSLHMHTFKTTVTVKPDMLCSRMVVAMAV